MLDKKFFESRVRYFTTRVQQKEQIVEKIKKVGTPEELHEAEVKLAWLEGQKWAFEGCLNYYQ